ncbi:unnamed protein product [Zymoseptoria tritici ST99CH_3D7]|uniref:Uncharacterized protein n=1 Tax=Zymoseptoria tritici (strain ST99CH_3D7) TaxID=1276538 RepID=A0A1X7RF06_ZYMT9|nr:unnamed protein product [Zymoseptoria tritici ST99CH_3D7]
MDGAGPGSRWLSTATSGKVGLSSGRNEMQFAVSFNKTVTERVKPAGRCHVQIVNASPPGAASDPAVLLIPLSRATANPHFSKFAASGPLEPLPQQPIQE